jgi:hypothetical protein
LAIIFGRLITNARRTCRRGLDEHIGKCGSTYARKSRSKPDRGSKNNGEDEDDIEGPCGMHESRKMFEVYDPHEIGFNFPSFKSLYAVCKITLYKLA